MENLTHRRTLCFSSYKNHKLKVNLWWVQEARERKKRVFFVPFFFFFFFCPKGIFLTFVFYLNVECIEYTFRIYILSHIKKHYFKHFCYLFLKSSKAFRVSLTGYSCEDFPSRTTQSYLLLGKDKRNKADNWLEIW